MQGGTDDLSIFALPNHDCMKFTPSRSKKSIRNPETLPKLRNFYQKGANPFLTRSAGDEFPLKSWNT